MTNGTRGMTLLAGGLLILSGCKETVEGEFLDTEGIAIRVNVTATSEDSSSMDIDFVVGGDEPDEEEGAVKADFEAGT